jgi:cell wall-associated NlpC family hydrolase
VDAVTATVAVTVANVWAVPGTATIPDDPHVWPTPRVSCEQRLGLVGHMSTQVLLGEKVVVLARCDRWTRIAVPDQPSPHDRRGYPGWVLTRQLRPAAGDGETVTVTVPKARLSTGREVGFGTKLSVIHGTTRDLVVRTAAGDVGRLPAAAARPLPRTRADLVRSATQFLGLHYLWGGLSAWGFDCSGLTWAVHRALGVTIPRDADAQFAAGRPVAPAAARPGDLVFYGTSHVHHVTMVVGGGRMIEAPNSAGEVRIVPIRADDLVGVRTFL